MSRSLYLASSLPDQGFIGSMEGHSTFRSMEAMTPVVMLMAKSRCPRRARRTRVEGSWFFPGQAGADDPYLDALPVLWATL
ncbi:hypothetical protein ASD31_24455 [Rhizobium sp. Root482]|nr:hypothetical protein ASD31_24455 [Rhizobium sp. Root482]